jgi:hypothetical protein
MQRQFDHLKKRFMQMKSGRFRKIMGFAILVLWFFSVGSLFIRKGSALLGLRAAEIKTTRPEIPADDPAPMLALLSACDKKVKENDILCVARSDEDSLQLYAGYRLAYELYPRKVASEGYRGKNLDAAIESLRRKFDPTLLLVFAKSDFVPPRGFRVESQLPCNALLLRLSN